MYKTCIIGMGYVGESLAKYISKYVPVIGYDINSEKTSEYCEVTNKKSDISDCNVYLVSVPTFSDNIKSIIDAMTLLSEVLKKDDVVVIESTVPVGTTKKICINSLEQKTGLKCGKDFYAGFSPERINPGDIENTLYSATKILSGNDQNSLLKIEKFYKTVLPFTKFVKAKSIEAAEMSKLVENAQRDVNIAFINDVAKACNKIDINIDDVTSLAETKWNFLPFKPGFVGGNCLKIASNYLNKLNKSDNMFISARNTNEKFYEIVYDEAIKKSKLIKDFNNRIAILGISYKEDVAGPENEEVIKLINNLSTKFDVNVFDTLLEKYSDIENINNSDILIVCINHTNYTQFQQLIVDIARPKAILDCPRSWINIKKDFIYWSL